MSSTPTTTSITPTTSHISRRPGSTISPRWAGASTGSRLKGWQLVVVDLNARFSAAARFGEELIIHTWIEEVGRVKSTWRQVMLRNDQEVARLTVSAAFTDLAGKPRRIPPEFAGHIRGLIPGA